MVRDAKTEPMGLEYAKPDVDAEPAPSVAWRARLHSAGAVVGLGVWWLAFFVLQVGLLGWVIAGKALQRNALMAWVCVGIVAALAGLAQVLATLDGDD